MKDTKKKVNFLDENNQTLVVGGKFFSKPSYMSQQYWEVYEAPRIGCRVGKGGKFIYGFEYEDPKWGEDERGDACDGGACSI